MAVTGAVSQAILRTRNPGECDKEGKGLARVNVPQIVHCPYQGLPTHIRVYRRLPSSLVTKPGTVRHYVISHAGALGNIGTFTLSRSSKAFSL